MLIILLFLLQAICIIVRGYVIQTFWGWFIQSQFQSLPTLSLIGCIGLSLFVAILTYMPNISTDQRKETSSESIKTSLFNQFSFLLGCLMSLIIGNIIHSLM